MARSEEARRPSGDAPRSGAYGVCSCRCCIHTSQAISLCFLWRRMSQVGERSKSAMWRLGIWHKYSLLLVTTVDSHSLPPNCSPMHKQKQRGGKSCFANENELQEGTGSERCTSTAQRRTASDRRAVMTRPDNPTSGTRGRYERAQGHRGTLLPRGEERSWVLAWMGMRPIGHRDLQTV